MRGQGPAGKRGRNDRPPQDAPPDRARDDEPRDQESPREHSSLQEHHARQDDRPRDDTRHQVGAAEPPDCCHDDRPPDADRRDAWQSPDDPGAVLRQAREARGLTIDDLSARTKIRRPILTALEGHNPAQLPAPVFTRGFVKAVARELGLDPDRTAAEYLAALTPSVEEVVETVRPPDAGVGRLRDHRYLQAMNQVGGIGGIGRLFTMLAAAGLVLYVITSSWRAADDGGTLAGADSAGVAAADHASLVADAPAPTATGRDDGRIATLAPGMPIHIELMPKAACWVSADVDGVRVVYKLLQPGEHYSLAVSDEVVLRVGEPSALAIAVNGVEGRPLGPPGRPVSVRITRDNFRDFFGS